MRAIRHCQFQRLCDKVAAFINIAVLVAGIETRGTEPGSP
jgi:hypothetical protein